MRDWRAWLEAARPRTLPASLAPLLLGNGLVLREGDGSYWLALISLLCATALQVLVNFANDLADGVGGIDSHERLGPPRMVQQQRISAGGMRFGIVGCGLVAVACGFYLAVVSSWWLLLLGAACLLAALAYSSGPWPLASHGLGEVTAFLFFGPVAVLGAAYVQTGAISPLWLLPAVAVGLPIAAIMLVNNIRDMPTDGPVGKRTLALRLGRPRSQLLYGWLLLLPVLLFSLLARQWWALPLAAGLGLWAFNLWRQVLRADGRAFNPMLAATARYTLAVALAWLLV
ncbi:MAG: 1,4-dihydroxy-2-naphthoate octaprenyltransferase [Gammaproteobacteria bacterium]|nr:1,4-dihydroxy-2-naphthoate octaprenyltransferase [Gammaproteobacteria bacterium]